MNAVGLTCEVLTGLRWRWLDRALAAEDTEAYEEHVLFCPPCLAENDKARASLAALRGAASPASAEPLVRRLVAGWAPNGGGQPDGAPR